MAITPFVEQKYPISRLPVTPSTEPTSKQYADLFALFNSFRKLLIDLDTAFTSGGGGSAVWGGITGVLSDQVDLQAALDAKEPTITPGATNQFLIGDKTWYTFGTAVNNDTGDFATAAQGATADSAVQPVDLAPVATSGDYNDLTNLPTLIPEAPIDGQQYARKDGAWEVVTGGGGSTGRTEVPVNAGSMAPSVSAGCAALSNIASAANQPDIQTLNFHQTTQQYAQFSVVIPKRWDRGTLTAIFDWSHAATTTNFNVLWGIQAVAVGDNEAINQAFGTAVEVTDTGGTTNRRYATAETSAFTVANSPQPGDRIFFRVYRRNAGTGNMAIVARLHGVVVIMTTDAGNDA